MIWKKSKFYLYYCLITFVYRVFVKDKNNPEVLANLTQELIATFREFLIARLIQNEVANLQAENPENTAQVLEQINNYNQLKVIMMRYLGRVRTG